MTIHFGDIEFAPAIETLTGCPMHRSIPAACTKPGCPNHGLMPASGIALAPEFCRQLAAAGNTPQPRGAADPRDQAPPRKESLPRAVYQIEPGMRCIL
jgi:hypothetical protein